MSLTAKNPADTRLGPRRTATVLLFFVTWLAVVGGFYLWRGFQRTTADLGTRLQASDPKTVQDAAIELSARMKQHDSEAVRWYPTLLKMAESASPEQRGIAAWIMAYGPARDDFHQRLLRLAKDASPAVRANAAVALDKFQDDAGRQCALDMVAGADADQRWEGLRALRVIGRKEDLAVTRRLESASDPRVRDAAKEASQGIDDRN